MLAERYLVVFAMKKLSTMHVFESVELTGKASVFF